MAGKRVIVLNCGVQGCCPEVEFTKNGDVEIRDDFGGKVKLTESQLKQLQSIDPSKVVAV